MQTITKKILNALFWMQKLNKKKIILLSLCRFTTEKKNTYLLRNFILKKNLSKSWARKISATHGNRDNCEPRGQKMIWVKKMIILYHFCRSTMIAICELTTISQQWIRSPTNRDAASKILRAQRSLINFFENYRSHSIRRNSIMLHW